MIRTRRAYILIFFLVILESSLSLAVHYPNLFPHLTLVVLLFISLHQGMRAGFACGIWLGFLLDMSSLLPFGTNIILYACVGTVCGLLKGMVFTDSFIAQWTVPAAAYLVVMLITLSLYQNEIQFNYIEFLIKMFKESAFLITVVTAPAMFYICRHFISQPKRVSGYVFLK
jgi:rod shape-determining protein MreD